MNPNPSLQRNAASARASRPSGRLSGTECRGVWLAACLILVGCKAPVFQSPPQSQDYRPENVFLYVPGLPADLKRVAVLPLACEDQRTDLADGCAVLNPILQAELARTKKFEAVSVNPGILQTRTGRCAWTGAEALPRDLFDSLRDTYGCDAVLFSQLTVFRAYTPLAVGWRMKLVDARTRQTLWAADDLFDAGEPAVLSGLEHYRQAEMNTSADTQGSWFMSSSPRRFGQYAAARLLATLPDR